jgi:eukaryotic-like serine/threonine-protein kinase
MSCLRESNAEPIPGYRLIEPVGSGGFGEVWKCEAPGGLFKAIKFVFGNLNSLDLDGARAEQELNALNRVKEVRHPFVLGMDRIEIIEGELVIVMELADRNLHDAFVEAQSAGLRGIPRDDLLRYLRDAAEALDYMCEKHNLQHLDIKPRNLFLVSDRVKVADFGLVKHLERTGGSGLLGGVTPLYAPPETLTGKIHQHSDQYSLAIVYQELLTSQRPFGGKNARALAQQHMHEEQELRSLPEAERPIVARALSKDPAKRFPSCLAFVRALYNARAASPGRDEGRGGKGRPKSMADTMEDIGLENVFHDDSDAMPRPAALRAAGLEEVEAEGDGPKDEPGVSPLDQASELGLTAALPQTGTLRPTVVIGLGSLGRRALMELRCRLLDRFGDLGKLPLIRFLYLDSDRIALQQAVRGAPEISLQPGEVYHLPLQPMAHYRRRQLEQLNEWLPREKLYALPRSLQTQGSRALGRLAFSDNYMRLVSRLKRDLQVASHPDVLYQSVENTGLALRDNTPRIVLVGAATGGASGYLIDLAYALRRQLRQLRQPDGRLTAYLFAGAPDDPATPGSELANLYATLTEINHYADGVTSFSAQYGTDGQRQSEQGPPFDAVYLLTQRVRTPEARRDMVAHLGSYLFHELITPLGPRLERERQAGGGSWDGPAVAFRSFGTHAVWFPRGLLLRLAARRAVGTLVRQWAQSEDESGIRAVGDSRLNQLGSPGAQADQNSLKLDAVEAAFARTLADPQLQPGALTQRIEEVAKGFLEGQTPPQALQALLTALEEQCWQFGGPDNPAAWAASALSRVRDWLGSGVQSGTGGLTVGVNRKSRLNRALENACSQLAEEWDKKLAAVTATLMALPGQRLAVAESGLHRLLEHFLRAGQRQAAGRKEQADHVAKAQDQLDDALRNCSGGGFRLFAWRPQRPLRVFLDLLAAFARQCLAEDTACAAEQFYNSLVARLRDRLRDLTLLRQRLRHVHEVLTDPSELPDALDEENTIEEDGAGEGSASGHSPTPMASLSSFWETSRSSSTTRVVLPEGETELERAAARFVVTLTADHWACLDQALQDEVLTARGGLSKVAFAGNDLQRYLIGPLVDRAAACLAQYLPVTDVAQVELAEVAGNPTELARHLKASLGAAAPLVPLGAAKRDSKVLATAGGPADLGAASREEPDKAVSRHSAWLLVPASEAGRTYAEEARKLLPEVQLVRVPGQADLMFCREQGGLSQEELERIIAPCRDAYQEAATLPASSPHSRFDTRDWVPLDP